MKKIASLLMGTACVAGSFLALAACSSPYEVASMDRPRPVVDARYDARPDAEAMAFIAPYQREVDSLMFPVVGETTHQMAPGRPESDLSNLLADIMVWAGTDFGEQPQLGVYNMGGIRANLPAGKVTKGDKRRAGGVHANAAMWVDPHLKNTCMIDKVGGSVSFYDTRVKLIKV